MPTVEPPLAQLQQQAGNQAMQQLLRAGIIHAKLAISQPDDPEEQEANRTADRIMRSHAGASATATPCSCGSDEDEMCDECKQKASGISRQATQAGPVHAGHRVLDTIRRSSGHPLDAGARAFFEPRFGRDFSHVRIHTDASAAASARSIQAHAFTAGSDIFFASGQFAPHSDSGRRLLAHELVHTFQLSRPGSVQRALDPANTAAWDWYDRSSHRDDPSYLETVSAAGGRAKELATNLSAGTAPKTDEERNAIDQKILTLIRLRGVTMVGEHRSELVKKQQQFEAMVQDTPDPTRPAPASGTSPRAADTVAAIRAAAAQTNKLNKDKADLEDLRNQIDRAVRMNAGSEAIPDEFSTLWEKAQPRSAPAVLQWLFVARSKLSDSSLSWGTKKLALFDLRNQLLALRNRQIQGIDLSIALIYNAFPFLADLSSSYITTGKKVRGTTGKVAAFGLALSAIANPALGVLAGYVAHEVFKPDKPLDDQTLLGQVRSSFGNLIEKTDESIVKVGSGSINPLDLPGAVASAEASLTPEMRTELEGLKQDHEVTKFATDMILALGIGVLTGVTGGLAGVGLAAYAAASGAVAAGAGLAQLGMQMKDLLDRQTLASASTDPRGGLLGVSAPTTFEWTVLAVGAALTAADLGGLAKEVAGMRPHFNEEPHIASSPSETRTPEANEGEPARPSESAKEGTTKKNEGQGAETAHPEAGKVQPANPAEARILEAGKGDEVPSPEQIESELAIVENADPLPLEGKEYKAEVELPNKHTWRETPDGHWCRFSAGRICVPGGRGKAAKDLIRSEADIDRLVEPLRPDIANPPASVKTPGDKETWALYNDYFADRVNKMRLDLRADGATTRDLPWTYDAFKQRWGDPEVARMLRGRLRQSQMTSAISELLETGGVVTEDTAISRVPNPTSDAGQIRRPDHLWPDQRGNFTAVSDKERKFAGMTQPEIQKVVMTDIRSALEDYYGVRYVRSKAHSLVGERIVIDEVFVNYIGVGDEALRQQIRAIGDAYKNTGVDVKIGFFDFSPP
jgi:hypothetical protein